MIEIIGIGAMIAYCFVQDRIGKKGFLYWVISFLILGYIYVHQSPNREGYALDELDEYIFPVVLALFPFVAAYLKKRWKEKEAIDELVQKKKTRKIKRS